MLLVKRGVGRAVLELFFVVLVVAAVAYKLKHPPNATERADKTAELESAARTARRTRRVRADQYKTDYPLEVVGESFYQRSLSVICGGRADGGHGFACKAMLRAEPGNPHDPDAVEVRIAGKRVGYLSRGEAKAFKAALRECGREGEGVVVDALIVGGWLRRDFDGVDEGSFGVRLKMVWSPKAGVS